ncbi:MAG: hypothetical protein IPM06_17710 [Rhizobiales bacterium]|nr:hypothetical protein [Hyphomicrobiales bacterium]
MYAKLFASLYQGTLRGCSDEILVFTNLLAHCGADGVVDKHFRAISEETGLSVDRVEAAIVVLESPDPESRSPEEEGRRIIKIDDHRSWGWRVVNHGKYRAIRSEEDRREQNRLAQQRWRDSKQNKPSVSTDKPSKPKQYTEAEEGEPYIGPNGPISQNAVRLDPIPYQKIVDLYHEHCPLMPKVVRLSEARRAQIRQRWKSGELPDLETWEKFFKFCSASKFLSGQATPGNGRNVFVANLEWITKEANFLKIWEKKYHEPV